MVPFEFGQDRLTEPHPLNSFKLAQGAIKVSLEAQLHMSRGTFTTCTTLQRLQLPASDPGVGPFDR
jgi:hypothetical protein